MAGRLITHSGSFHADDLFSFAILSRLFPDHEYLRTRSEDILSNTTPEDIVFDVGMVFSPENRRYDHHMRDAPQREDGVNYSSVGLVWRFHGHDYLRLTLGDDVPVETINRIWKKMDLDLVYFLDCADTGFDPSPTMSSRLPISFSLMIETFNPASDEERPDYDSAFLDASSICRTFFDRKIEHLYAYERGRSIVLEALENSKDPRVLELSSNVDWSGHLLDLGNDSVLFAIYPAHGNWYCSAAKVSKDSWDNRLDLPLAWGGLRDEALAAVCGTPDAVFCHDKLFVCVAKSREGIMDMVTKTLEYAPRPSL